MNKIELVADPRDGLQGLNYPLDNQKYVEHLIHIAESGFKHIMIGSMINPHLVPAMAGSEARAILFFEKYPAPELKRQILVFRPYGKYMDKAEALIEKKAANSIAYTHSLSGEFLYNNNGIGRKEFPTYSDESRQKIIEESREIVKQFTQKSQKFGTSLDVHMSKVTHQLSDVEIRPKLLAEIKEEFIILAEITKDVEGRIVFSDTSGEATPENIKPLMQTAVDAILENNIQKPIGLHLHTNPKNNDVLSDLLLSCLEPLKQIENTVSFDIGFGGIGGCPFDSKNPKANLQVKNILQTQSVLNEFGVEVLPSLDMKNIEMLDEEILAFVNEKTDSKQKTIFERFKSLFGVE
ncbi:hypothetical protein [Candidatus Uabimicrobium amorphum]|uniref:hypothetical protein n=1 Tax=Uabimicrobium amorphum TaxID=2596890 RepID=UPI00125FB345|nr:hypothetical protein [Candidatus Uabimicrobium amorphum]